MTADSGQHDQQQDSRHAGRPLTCLLHTASHLLTPQAAQTAQHVRVMPVGHLIKA
jgi:hypothetical protein